MQYEEDLQQSRSRQPQYRKAIRQLKKQNRKEVDETFHTLHHHVFEEIDCLACANCCKTTSPIFRESDIERLSKALKMSVSDFKKTYLKIDPEGDWVLKEAPCPFLGHDNKCIVYENRPRACREYPHTDRKHMYQILQLTLRNSLVCPAVGRIMHRIHQHL
jgi:hypothetical protein